jgi:hypothetical protein
MTALQRHIASHNGSSWKRIVLENGTYPGALNVNKAKIQIYSRNLNGAVLTGAVTLSSADSLISRCKSTAGIVCSGARTRVNRCLVQGTGSASIDIVGINIKGNDVRVDGNEITRTGTGVLITSALRPIVERNWLHDQGTPPSNRLAWIYIGSDRTTSLLSQECLVRYNRFESSVWHQHAELKSKDNRVIGNTNVQGGILANLYNRHGPANYFALNWIVGDESVIGASDKSTILIMNHGRAAIRAGQISGDQLRAGAKGIVYAEDTIVALHDGPIEMGWNQGAGPIAPKRTILEESNGPIIQTVQSSFTRRPLTVARPSGIFRELLAPADVGQQWS